MCRTICYDLCVGRTDQRSIKRTRNAVYQIAYHAVWIPKYRRKVLVGDVVDRLRGVVHEVAQEKGVEVLALEVQPDHVPLCFSAPPRGAPSLALHLFTGITARVLVTECPRLRPGLRRGQLGAPSFYGGTAGYVSSHTLKKDIARAGHSSARR